MKQLQQELEERKKMGRARDVIISNLEREKIQMQKKREIRIVNSNCVLKIMYNYSQFAESKLPATPK